MVSNAIHTIGFGHTFESRGRFSLTSHGMLELFHSALLSDDNARALIGVVAIEGNPRRIVATVFQSVKAIDQYVGDKLSIALHQIIQVAKDACLPPHQQENKSCVQVKIKLSPTAHS
jgi:hypothetical protein